MKSFDDFMNSIDFDELGKEINQITKPSVIITQTTPEAIAACLNKIYNQAIIDSVKVSLLYLRKYHEWLEQ